MASLANAIQFSIQPSQFPCGNKSFSTRTSTSGLVPCNIQSVSSSLGFAPESFCFSPLGISGKALKFSGWDQLLRRRGSVDFPVTKAADADDHEIESVDGCGTNNNFSYIHLVLYSGQF